MWDTVAVTSNRGVTNSTSAAAQLTAEQITFFQILRHPWINEIRDMRAQFTINWGTLI